MSSPFIVTWTALPVFSPNALPLNVVELTPLSFPVKYNNSEVGEYVVAAPFLIYNWYGKNTYHTIYSVKSFGIFTS